MQKQTELEKVAQIAWLYWVLSTKVGGHHDTAVYVFATAIGRMSLSWKGCRRDSSQC